jgi:hypothetical protein
MSDMTEAERIDWEAKTERLAKEIAKLVEGHDAMSACSALISVIDNIIIKHMPRRELGSPVLC